jgi:hypothetical protein
MPPDYDALRAIFERKSFLLTQHASDRAAQRVIRSDEIVETVVNGAVIEDYPDDKYGPSCLILGNTDAGRILHVQISYPPDVKVITVYVPAPEAWEPDWKTRK